jgi:uncharacterized protein YxeA
MNISDGDGFGLQRQAAVIDFDNLREREQMKRTLISLLVLMLLSGCAAFKEKHSRTILLNRDTGERVECTVDMLRTQEAYERYKACISSYEAQGYSIWGQY